MTSTFIVPAGSTVKLLRCGNGQAGGALAIKFQETGENDHEEEQVEQSLSASRLPPRQPVPVPIIPIRPPNRRGELSAFPGAKNWSFNPWVSK